MDKVEIRKIVDDFNSENLSEISLSTEGGTEFSIRITGQIVIGILSFSLNSNKETSEIYISLLYPEIQKTIQPILAKNGLIGSSDQRLNSTFHLIRFDQNIKEEFYSKFEKTSIANAQNLILSLQNLVKCANFFDQIYLQKYDDYQNLLSITEKLDQSALNNYFGTGGIFFKALVLKFSDSPSFKEYFDWLYHGLVIHKDDSMNDPIWDQYKMAAIELKEIVGLENAT
jgi:hypothetical protein